LNLADLDKHQRDVREVIERASRAQYPKNQWVEAHGLTLQEFLARPMNDIRSALSKCLESAHATDQTIHPAIPPFDPTKNLDDQARTRAIWPIASSRFSNPQTPTPALWATQASKSSKTRPSDSKTSTVSHRPSTAPGPDWRDQIIRQRRGAVPADRRARQLHRVSGAEGFFALSRKSAPPRCSGRMDWLNPAHTAARDIPPRPAFTPASAKPIGCSAGKTKKRPATIRSSSFSLITRPS
jgi:hypothetical protein